MPPALLIQSYPRYKSVSVGGVREGGAVFVTFIFGNIPSSLKTSCSSAAVNADYTENCTTLHFDLAN